ncbi:MAG: ATP-binding cassette domain-containing protein [Actinobacteria bacterium]|nr:ATP-binding cassette domain-containing protein [Actinomycetota bacterium]
MTAPAATKARKGRLPLVAVDPVSAWKAANPVGSKPSGAILALDSVWKIYGTDEHRVEAVRNVSFEVEQGDYVAITGPSGSGKSTLLQIIGLLDRPTTGGVLYQGQDVSDLTDAHLSAVRNLEVGFVFQAFHLLPRATALANVELPLLYRGVPRKERERLAHDALDMVGLADRATHRPNELSGGQRQRVAIARALAANPALLLADEPTGNLDSKSSRDVMGLLGKLNEDLGVAIVLITHEADVAAHASRELRMLDGELAEVPSAERIPATATPEATSKARKPSSRSNPPPSDAVTSDAAAPAPRVATNGHTSVHAEDASDRADISRAKSVLLTRDLIYLGFGALRANRMRSMLTSLGVIIGVASVVILIAVGTGARNAITSGIESLGSNQVLVFPGSIDVFGSGGLPPASPLRQKDLDALARLLGPEAVITGTMQSGGRASAGPNRHFVNMTGTTATYLDVQDKEPLIGSFFTQSDVIGRKRVMVLGSAAAAGLFPDGEAVGRTVTLQGAEFRVIGLLDKTKGGMSIGFDPDNFVYMPLTTFQDVTGRTPLDLVQVKAPNARQVDESAIIMKEYLQENYPDDELTVLSQDEILGLVGQFLDIFTFFLAGIAGVSLLVGGIGIMNVTLVSVTERTREIGVRRAIGARSRHVMAQFLLEAVVTSFTGGAVGLTLAVIGARVVAVFSPVPAVVTFWAVGLALLVSIGVGVFFGVWPARRAALLDPVEALRHE